MDFRVQQLGQLGRRPPPRGVPHDTVLSRSTYSRGSTDDLISVHEEVFNEERNNGRDGSRGRGRGRGRGRRQANRRGEHSRDRPVRLGFKALQELDTKNPDEIILDLTSSRRFPATEVLLTQQSDMKDDWIVLIVSIVAKACGCSSKEYLFKLLNLLPKSVFLTGHFRQFLNRLSACRLPASNVVTFLNNAIRIMNEMLHRFPNCYDELPVTELYFGVKILSDSGELGENSLMKHAEELFKLRSQKAEELKKKEEEKQHRRRPRIDGENIYTVVSICRENMPGYLPADIICSEKRTLFREKP